MPLCPAPCSFSFQTSSLRKFSTIEINNLHKSFDNREVLKGITSRFESGKTNLIIGQSGSGKTVLIKNIVGLFEPTEGDVLYDGRSFMSMNKKERALLRREMGNDLPECRPL